MSVNLRMVKLRDSRTMETACREKEWRTAASTTGMDSNTLLSRRALPTAEHFYVKIRHRQHTKNSEDDEEGNMGTF